MSVNILTGDVFEMLATLPDDHFDCIVTSPPYWGLRDYGVAGQIGLEPTLDAYVDTMSRVARDLCRVLKPSGTFFLNLGDSYFASRGREQRATPCGTLDKEPVNSQENDCLCESLCGACRAAYRIGKSHTSNSPVSTQGSSTSESIHGRRGLRSFRLPTSGFPVQVDRSEAAKINHAQDCLPEPSPFHGAPASTSQQFSAPLPDSSCSQTTTLAGECLLCGLPLPRSSLAFDGNSACICDIGATLGASSQHRLDIGSSNSAYQHYTTTFLKPKDLCMIPARVALRLQADGWWLRSEIVWAKPNPMPESVTDRPTSAHEKVFLLTKAERYFYDAAAIAEEATPASASRYKYDFSGAPDGLKNPGGTERLRPEGRREFTGKRNARNVWTIATQAYSGAHFATMPADLAERCILAGCPVGGNILDPFFGAGTTGIVADRLGRNCTGIELNPAFVALAEARVRADAGMFAEVDSEAAE